MSKQNKQAGSQELEGWRLVPQAFIDKFKASIRATNPEVAMILSDEASELLASAAPAPAAEPVYDQSVVKRIATQMGWTPPSASPAALTMDSEAILAVVDQCFGSGYYSVDNADWIKFARVLLTAQPAEPAPHANCPAPADEAEATEREHFGCAHCSTGIYAAAEPARADRQCQYKDCGNDFGCAGCPVADRQGVALSERAAFEAWYAPSRSATDDLAMAAAFSAGYRAASQSGGPPVQHLSTMSDDAIILAWVNKMGLGGLSEDQLATMESFCTFARTALSRAPSSRAEVERDAARYQAVRAGINNGDEWIRIVGSLRGSGSLSLTGEYADSFIDRMLAAAEVPKGDKS